MDVHTDDQKAAYELDDIYAIICFNVSIAVHCMRESSPDKRIIIYKDAATLSSLHPRQVHI